MPESRELRIYQDGNCPFCRWSQQIAERYDRDRRLSFRDYHLPEHRAETPFALDQLSRRMHARTPDGRWHAGFFAWIEILRVLPRWRRLARLLALPPLRWLGPPAYQWIADNRYRIPRFVLRWLGAPPVCGTACEV